MAVDRLLIFARQPIPGQVKTRLMPALSPEMAAAVYEACLHDVVKLAARERGRVELWYDGGSSAERYFTAEFPVLLVMRQVPGDLGERMRDAFDRSFDDGAERVIIMGSDSPTLPETHLNAAFDTLHEQQAVVGPAIDGGYYLIGLRADAWPDARAIFTDIAWSTSAVLEQTLERAGRAGIAMHSVPQWYDIDSVDDLRVAAADMLPDSRLNACLKELPL